MKDGSIVYNAKGRTIRKNAVSGARMWFVLGVSLILGAALIYVVCFFYWDMLDAHMQKNISLETFSQRERDLRAYQGTCGDAFGALNTFFAGVGVMVSALAFGGFIIALAMQREDLNLQREEIERVREEMTKQNLMHKEDNIQRRKKTIFDTVNAEIENTYMIINSLSVVWRVDKNTGKPFFLVDANEIEAATKHQTENQPKGTRNRERLLSLYSERSNLQYKNITGHELFCFSRRFIDVYVYMLSQNINKSDMRDAAEVFASIMKTTLPVCSSIVRIMKYIDENYNALNEDEKKFLVDKVAWSFAKEVDTMAMMYIESMGFKSDSFGEMYSREIILSNIENAVLHEGNAIYLLPTEESARKAFMHFIHNLWTRNHFNHPGLEPYLDITREVMAIRNGEEI